MGKHNADNTSQKHTKKWNIYMKIDREIDLNCVLSRKFVYKFKTLLLSLLWGFPNLKFLILINCFISRYFTIVGSKVIRPDTDYHLSITSQGYKDSTSYRVSINGTDDDGGNYLQSKDITVLNDGTQTLIFDVSKKNKSLMT